MNDEILNVPEVEPIRFERNYITTAVCELRFPTLLELENKLPPDFQKALRKEFPFYEKHRSIEVSGGDASSEHYRYLFKSKKKNWTASLRSFSLSLETNHYTEFKDFYDVLGRVLDVSKDYIDTDFFTRVGLRYINFIPIEDGKYEGWLNHNLTAPIETGSLGAIQNFSSEVHGLIEKGNYSMRYGLKSTDSPDAKKEYLLDFDYYSEDVDFVEVLERITEFNKINFSFFNWCLGEKGIAHLGRKTPKKGA